MIFVVPRFHTNIYFATRFLVEAGWSVHVFVESAVKREDHSFVQPKTFRLPADRARLADAFLSARPDLVLLRRTKYLTWPVRLLALRSRVPVWTYSQRPLDSPRSLRNKLRKLLSGLPLRRITPVPGLDPAVSPDPSARLIPWPVAALCPPCPPEEPGVLRALCVATLGQTRKNVLPLLTALSPLGRGGKLHLTLIGNTGGGNRVQLQEIRAAAKQSWLTLHESVDFTEMPKHHAAADVAILPAYDEPLGTSPVESMAYGAVPCIATGCGSAGYITHGENGFRFAPDDITPLVGALNSFIENPAHLASMRDRARHYAETELGRARFLERMEALLPTPARYKLRRPDD